MSAFEVVVTPTRILNARKVNANHEPTIVILAPFSSKSVVTFEDIPVTKTARRYLDIKNPSDEELKVLLTKNLKPELNAIFNWTSIVIPSKGCQLLEIIWTPTTEISLKETIQFTDNRNFKKDVSIILKSIDKKSRVGVGAVNKKIAGMKKSATKCQPNLPPQRLITTKLKLKTPSPPKRFNRKTSIHSTKINIENETNKLKNKAFDINVEIRAKEPLTINNQNKLQENPYKTDNNTILGYNNRNGKENQSPATPQNATNLFDNIQFTPAFNENNLYIKNNNKISTSNKKYDYLAELPTPKNDNKQQLTIQQSSVKTTFNNVRRDNEERKEIFKVTISPHMNFENTTPQNLNFTDLKLYDLETPKGVHNAHHENTSAVVRNNEEITNTTRFLTTPGKLTKPDETYFEPPIVSTATRESMPIESNIEKSQYNRRSLFAAYVSSPCNMGIKESSVTEENVIDTVHQYKHINTETEINKLFKLSPLNITNEKSLASPQLNNQSVLSIINEEDVVFDHKLPYEIDETFAGEPKEFCKTFNITGPSIETVPIVQETSTENINLLNSVNNLVATPIHKKYKSMKELCINNNNNLSAEQRALKNNLGSMPNLHDVSKLKSIDNNRYYYQSKENNINEENSIVNNLSGQTAIVNDVNFKENEILAQSSVFNIHEIGRQQHQQKLQIPQQQQYNLIAISNIQKTPSYKLVVEKSNNNVINKNVSSLITRTSSSVLDSKVQQIPVNKLDLSASRSSASSSSSASSTLSSTCSNKRVHAEIDKNFHRKVTNKYSPPKRLRFDTNDMSTETSNSNGQSFRRNTWGSIKSKKFRVPAVPMQRLTLKKPKEEERVILFDAELHISGVINPDPFAATITTDPFLASTMYLDEKSVDQHEKQFKKWLNALVTIPEDFNCNENDAIVSAKKIDFGRLFNEVRNKDINVAPTKECVSSKYLTSNYRMDSLRKAAIKLYLSDEMRIPLEKLIVHIERKLIHIRNDRNLHLDIVLQREILELLLCINPLWLRIGLEVVYGELISMNNNSDIMSLSTFIINRLFKDLYLESKYARVYTQTTEYAEHIKKFTLKKFLFLLYFLDVAKCKKIIMYNPCLFVYSSPYKSIKEILLKFSSTLLGNIGDIQKDLKRIDIILTHKQTYIDEFDYAFRNLAIDLRDGVRLTKIMEIILLRDDLTVKLRCPAISRLQRVHNVDLAIRALKEAGYIITGGITANDIADGHREKTLSLLWQIIYKFRAPRFNSAAMVLQKWWRYSFLRITINRRIKERIYLKQKNAANKIQSLIRGYLERKRYKMYKDKLIISCVYLQSHIRRFLTVRNYQKKLHSIIVIQKWYRSWQLVNAQRSEFLMKKQSIMRIQKWYRRCLLIRMINNKVISLKAIQLKEKLMNHKASIIQQKYRAYKLMKISRKEYLEMRSTTIFVQQKFRAILKMRAIRREYINLKITAIFIQRKFLSNLNMKCERSKFLLKRNACICIQQNIRAYFMGKKDRTQFLQLKQSTIKIQIYYRNYRLMIQDKENYQRKLKATKTIQCYWKAVLDVRTKRKEYLQLKTSTINVQQRFRSNLLMKQQRIQYLQIKNSTITIQRYLKSYLLMKNEYNCYQTLRCSTIFIQRKYAAKLAMLKQRKIFVQQKRAAITIQTHYRCTQLMKKQRENYLNLKQSTIFVQQLYRANVLQKLQRSEYCTLKTTTIFIQQKFRANKLMTEQRLEYLKIKQSCISIQQKYKAQKLMLVKRTEYLQLKSITIKLQRYYRAQKLMQFELEQYQRIRNSTIIIQKKLLATLQMRKEYNEYQLLRRSAIKIQQFYRANNEMKKQRATYLLIKSNTIFIQHKYRAIQSMKIEHNKYIQLKKATSTIQKYFRATQEMHAERKRFLELKNATICIQQKWRALQIMKIERVNYLKLLHTTIYVQQLYRANVAMMEIHSSYLCLKQSAIIVQRKYKANQLMKIHHSKFMQLKKYTIKIQQLYRAKSIGCIIRTNYLQLLNATIFIQRKFKANQLMQIDRNYYQKLRLATIFIQQKFTANLNMKLAKHNYLQLQKYTILMQQRFRANRLMKIKFKQFITLKISVKIIEEKWYSIKLMRTERNKYIQLKSSVITVQQKWRATLTMRSQRKQYLLIKSSTILIQKYFQSYLLMQNTKANFNLIKRSTITIQTYYRSYAQMKCERKRYLQLKEATILIQRKVIANKRMQQERLKYLQILNAINCIQKYLRATVLGKSVRSKYLQMKNACILIQRKFRATQLMRKQQSEYNLLRNNVIIIQQRYRSLQLTKYLSNQYLIIKFLIIWIQRKFRATMQMRCERKEFLKLRTTIIFTQQKWRGKKQMLIEREQFIQKRELLIKLQSRIRGHLVRKEYLKKFTPEMLELKKQKKAAKIIQSFWRGYRIRRTEVNHKLKYIRKRVKELQINVEPQNTIKYKLKHFVKQLKERFNINECLLILTRLENISRTVPHVLISDASFIANFCYGMMSQAIRSEADKQLIELCSAVILNMARYEHTKIHAFQENGLVPVAQLLLRWCDKECGIFNTLCTVIWIFAQNSNMNNKIRNFMTTHEAIYLLRETKKLVIRKEKMRQNIKPLLNVTVPYMSARQKRQLPMLETDYGLHSNKSYIFYSSVFAFDTILSQLQIYSIN